LSLLKFQPLYKEAQSMTYMTADATPI